MKWKRIIQILMVIFVTINFLLVYLDDEGKVERTAYINNWSESFVTDMAEKLYKPGVLTAAKEEQLYFDENLGSFQEFLVEEGSEVSAGDPIYSYLADNYYETEANLMNQVEQINGEITAIESAISEMQRYQIPTENEAAESPDTFSNRDVELRIEFPQSSIDANLMKEQYLVEKEKELAQKQAQLQSAENQLTELRSSGDTIIVESPYDGRISSLNTSLEDPVITIESAELYATGELTEQERKQLEAGLASEVTVQEMPLRLNGSVQKVSTTPNSVEIDGESIYPFHIAFDEDAEVEDLLPGYHADITITMEESEDATVLVEDAVFSDSVWKMTNAGRLVKQNVETGLSEDGRIEIADGVETGEWVATDPPSLFRNGADFITPLQVNKIDKVSFSFSNWKRSFVTGILAR